MSTKRNLRAPMTRHTSRRSIGLRLNSAGLQGTGLILRLMADMCSSLLMTICIRMEGACNERLLNPLYYHPNYFDGYSTSRRLHFLGGIMEDFVLAPAYELVRVWPDGSQELVNGKIGTEQQAQVWCRDANAREEDCPWHTCYQPHLFDGRQVKVARGPGSDT